MEPFLPVWTEEEMDQFCDDFGRYRDLYGAMDVHVKEKVQENFEELGGVPQYVLKNNEMVVGRKLFEGVILELSAELCWKLMSGAFVQGLSDKIIHICVENVGGKCNYSNPIYAFASSKAQICVWQHLHSIMPAKIVQYISDHWDHPNFGPIVGDLYEAVSLEILRRGGSFKRRRVWEESHSRALPSILVLVKLDSSNFVDLKGLENMKDLTCYKPMSRNFESVDAVISSNSRVDVPRLVQIFKPKKGGENRGYKLQGLKNVDNVLKSKKYELLLCVPSECYKEIEFQTWCNKNGTKCVDLTRD